MQTSLQVVSLSTLLY